jgi:hypothetical protein
MSGPPANSDRVRVVGLVGASRSVLDGAKELARRSRRLSWLSWGFLYASWGGFGVLLAFMVFFAVTTTSTVPGGGVNTTTMPPLWGYPIAFAPTILLLGWALHELFAGRSAGRAAIRGASPSPLPPGDRDDSPGWTQQVVDAQKLLTAAKLETDWSFFPLAIGLLGWAAAVATAVFAPLGGAASLYALVTIAVGVGVGGLALYLLYRVAREWIGGFQDHLDRQVREVSALEAEFLWRFAGTPA